MEKSEFRQRIEMLRFDTLERFSHAQDISLESVGSPAWPENHANLEYWKGKLRQW